MKSQTLLAEKTIDLIKIILNEEEIPVIVTQSFEKNSHDKEYHISIFLNSSYRRMFLAGSATLGGTGGAGHVHPPTFKETKVFFLLVLPRFTSWNWLVWITFSSVLTMGQCLPLHVTLYFKLTIFPVCLVCKLHGNACAPRLIVYLSHTKFLTSHSRSHFQSIMKS